MNDAQLYSLLSSNPGITAITDKIYNGLLPEGEPLPAVTFEMVSEQPYNNLSGDTGSGRALYTINVWSESLAEVHLLSTAVRAAMSGYPRTNHIALHEQERGLYRFAFDYSSF